MAKDQNATIRIEGGRAAKKGRPGHRRTGRRQQKRKTVAEGLRPMGGCRLRTAGALMEQGEQPGTARGRHELAAAANTNSTGDSPLDDATRVEQLTVTGDSPVRAKRPCELALEQGNMENLGVNLELEIEEIIKAAREVATTHSKDWILKQNRGSGTVEGPTQEERDSDRTSGTAHDGEYPPSEAKKQQRTQAEVPKKGTRET
ncbi:hypothetical protein NDU88_007502 [Pleurodeles waltl]|uniref:Uncharacterized protein n=1 Tax=Pleurodeles waltl TaxID=8319 RepID=A0AAV7QP94_PLEWA|nr:hypothetical protein NDU88_007502 [Pleurodeles waltl]